MRAHLFLSAGPALRGLIVLTAALAVAACSGPADPPADTGAPTPKEAVLSEDEVTCEQLVTDPRGLGSQMATDRTDGHEPGAGYSALPMDMYAAGPDGELVAFLGDGTRLNTYQDVMVWACEQRGSGTMTLTELRETLFGNESVPMCTGYLAAPPEEGALWIEVAAFAAGQPIPPQEQVTAACAADDEQALPDVVNAILAGEPLTEPTPEGTVLAWQTTTNLGYTTDHSLTVGAVQSVTRPHPEWPVAVDTCPAGDGNMATCDLGGGEIVTVPPFTAGTTCGVDPATDALIPLKLTVTNTTSGYDTALSSRFTVARASGSAPETVEVAVVTWFGQENGCEDAANGTVNTGVNWAEPQGTGYPVTSLFFIVLHDYYSPRFPEGNTADLARYVITGQAPSTADDPSTVTTPGVIHLDGTPVG